tara:strand:+ start:56 stop:169 length:114 start_codon:yes stop_codon:yes gene_type:complete
VAAVVWDMDMVEPVEPVVIELQVAAQHPFKHPMHQHQ